jgi:hypothetical protein
MPEKVDGKVKCTILVNCTADFCLPDEDVSAHSCGTHGVRFQVSVFFGFG